MFARLHIVPRLAASLAEYRPLEMQVLLDARSSDLIEADIDVALGVG